jgi:predicted CXXCH cytochrome family protein
LYALSLVFVATMSMGVSSCQKPGTVGNGVCLQCHNGQSGIDQRSFLQSKHKSINCEDCHGPGYAHVRNGGRGGLLIANPLNQPFDQSYTLCAKCHATNVAGYVQSKHATEKAARCIDCHDVHRVNGFTVATANNQPHLDNPATQALCGRCHDTEEADFLQSKHAQVEVATCTSCHNLHKADTFQANPLNNQMCLQCHNSFQLGFTSDAVTQAHVGAVHPLDPAGTGAGRCVACHLPPVQTAGQPDVAHHHTLAPIPPSASNAAIQANINPIPPNSCSGVMGCHDASVPGSGTPRDVTNVADNTLLQSTYDTIGLTP